MSSSGYRPDFFDDDLRLNVLGLFDVHTGQKNGKDYSIGHNLGEYANSVAQEYNIDEIVIGGDFGSRDALTGFLNSTDEDLTVRIIEGDGDREEKKIEGEEIAGWSYHTDLEAEEPFPNTNSDYEVEGRSFRYEFENYEVWIQHENKDKSAENILFNVEADLRGMDYRLDEFPEEFLDFPPIIGVHGHNHRAQCSQMGSGALFSMDSFRNAYETTSLVPDRGYHILSLGVNQVDNLHVDADKDEIFEHHCFELRDGSFKKEFKFGKEHKELSPLQRFKEVPEQVRETERFNPRPTN